MYVNEQYNYNDEQFSSDYEQDQMGMEQGIQSLSNSEIATYAAAFVAVVAAYKKREWIQSLFL
mgnify:CR=1 FL=1